MLLNSTFALPVKSGRIPYHFSSILLKIARMSIKRPRGVHRWAWPWLWHFTCWSCIHGFSRVFMQTLYSSEGNMAIPAFHDNSTHRTADVYGDRKYSLMREAPSLASMPSRSPRILASQISKLRWISLKLFLIELSALLVHILASAVSSSPKLPFAVSACSVLSFCLVSVARCWRWNASSKNSVCRCVLNSEFSVESQGSLVCCTNTYPLVFLPCCNSK